MIVDMTQDECKEVSKYLPRYYKKLMNKAIKYAYRDYGNLVLHVKTDHIKLSPLRTKKTDRGQVYNKINYRDLSNYLQYRDFEQLNLQQLINMI